MKAMSIKSLIRRDHWAVLFGLFSVTALAWIYLIIMATNMDDTVSISAIESVMSEMKMTPWTAIDFVMMFVMWSVMMVGMMMPSAVPMILMFIKINDGQRNNNKPAVHTGVFIAGYIAVWSAFSLIATALQFGLQEAALLSPMMTSTNFVFSGLVLVVAGIYQWLPFKNSCLRLCQTPLGFLMTRWREGANGAFKMGLSHGAYCVGCCWAIMALLFVNGVMNLMWVAALSIFVFVEKITQPGPWVSRISGAIMIVWGCGILILVE